MRKDTTSQGHYMPKPELTEGLQKRLGLKVRRAVGVTKLVSWPDAVLTTPSPTLCAHP